MNERDKNKVQALAVSGNKGNVLWKSELREQPRAAPSVQEGFVEKAELEEDSIFLTLSNSPLPAIFFQLHCPE